MQGLTAKPVDLAVLDIKMPRMDGMELLQRLRQRSSMPVIFLTCKDEEVDELMGLRLGADDYITKPFSQRLLLERIRALLRRNEASRAEGSGATPAGVMMRGDLVLDETKHQCLWKGTDIQLTVTEFLLVKALADAARHGEVARPADRRRLRREHLRRRPHHRQPRQARAQEIPQRSTTASTRSRRSTASATATRRPEPDARQRSWLPSYGSATAARAWVSPLLRRILLVNALPLALLLAALLYLDQYQNGLLEAEVATLREQARIFAGALGETAVQENAGRPRPVPDLARPLLRRLTEPTPNAQAKLYAPDGTLVADSRVREGAGGAIVTEPLPPPPPQAFVARHRRSSTTHPRLRGCRTQNPGRCSTPAHPPPAPDWQPDVQEELRLTGANQSREYAALSPPHRRTTACW